MNEQLLEKVRNLLNKAERTENAHEAEAFSAKAQELMTKYQIDSAMVADAGDVKRSFNITRKRIAVPAPYQLSKINMFNHIAKVNDCDVVRLGKSFVEVFGTAEDIEMVEMLWTSMMLQSAMQLPAAEQEWNRSKSYYDTTSTKMFRLSYIEGYGSQIARRLRESKRETVANSAPGVGLVLADKANLSRTALSEAYPQLRTSTTSRAMSGAGIAAGRAAANKANLGQRSVSSRKVLPKG